MTVQQIIQTAIMTGVLTSAQDHSLNVLLFKEECGDTDMFLLRRLARCIADGSVVKVEQLNADLSVGHFGLRVVAAVGESFPHPERDEILARRQQRSKVS